MASRLITTYTVPESLIHIHQPIAQQVAMYVAERLGYLDLFRQSDNGIIVTSDQFDFSKTKNKDGNAAIRDERMLCLFQPNVNPRTNKWEGSGTTTALANGNTVAQNQDAQNYSSRIPGQNGKHIPGRRLSILHDDVAGIDLSEMAVGCSMNMECTMEFHDEFRATECLSRIFQCFTNGEMINYVDIMYDYPVPTYLQGLLRYLYHLKRLSENNPDGNITRVLPGGKKVFDQQKWYDWMKKYSNGAISYLFNRNTGTRTELVVNKNHFQALYAIDCSMEVPEKLDPHGYCVKFTLTIQFSRANILALEYPVIVNNNYVDPKYVPLERKIREAGPTTMIMWQNPNVTFDWQRTYIPWPPKPFKFPFYDPWIVPSDSRASQWDYKPVLVAAFTLDNLDSETEFTTFDFDTTPAEAFESKIDDQILQCIMEKKNKVLDCEEFVNIAVYADDVQVANSELDISDGHTLIIKCKDRIPIYRLVVSIGKPRPKGHYDWNRVWIVHIHTNPKKGHPWDLDSNPTIKDQRRYRSSLETIRRLRQLKSQ